MLESRKAKGAWHSFENFELAYTPLSMSLLKLTGSFTPIVLDESQSPDLIDGDSMPNAEFLRDASPKKAFQNFNIIQSDFSQMVRPWECGQCLINEAMLLAKA